MSQGNCTVSAHDSVTGEKIEVTFTEKELQETIRNALVNGICASFDMEGMDLSNVTFPPPSTIPRSILTT